MSRRKTKRAKKNKIAIRDGYKCIYCGELKPPFEIDHVIPLSKGGTNKLTNLVMSCRKCNSIKADNLPHEINDNKLRNRVEQILMYIKYDKIR